MTGDGHRTTLVIEVTDTLGADFTTGIQRVVREVIAHLRASAPDLDVVPVVTPSAREGFRTLTADETARLASHPAGGRAGRRADDFGRLSPLARRVGDLPVTVSVRTALGRLSRRRRQVHPPHPELAYSPPAGSVFLDLEGSWYDPTPRAELLPRLHASGVRSMVFVHDVMPVVHPEWFTPRHIAVFRRWLEAHLEHSVAVLANSGRTASDVAAVAAERGRNVEATVVPLGGDPPVAASVRYELPEAIDRFVLVVGTLEPRKNQRLVLDAFDALRSEHPDLGLVLVGKEGWMVDDLVARIRTHPEHGRRLLWLGGIDDAALASLYEQAFLCVAPSLYEGLGVPVTEALSRGCATLVSTGGAQPEAAGGSGELFDPTDGAELVGLLRRHLDDPEHHHDWVQRAREHRSPTWAETAEVVAEAVRQVARRGGADHRGSSPPR